LDIYRFLEHFDRVLDGNCEKEIKSDYEMRSKLSRIKLSFPTLREAGSAHIEGLEGNMYTVDMCDIDNEI